MKKYTIRDYLFNGAIAVVISIPICVSAHYSRNPIEVTYTPEIESIEPEELTPGVTELVTGTVTKPEIIFKEIETVTEETETPETETDTVIEETETATEEIDADELDLLAHLIFAEAGSNKIPDETLYYVGSVVLNRVKHELYPDTMYEVIYQKGQYACTWDGNIEKEPTERCYRIAEDLLRNGSVLPDNVIFQAGFKQGNGVYAYQNGIYFCYY